MKSYIHRALSFSSPITFAILTVLLWTSMQRTEHMWKENGVAPLGPILDLLQSKYSWSVNFICSKTFYASTKQSKRFFVTVSLFFCSFEPNCTTSGKKTVTGVQVVTASQVQSIGCMQVTAIHRAHNRLLNRSIMHFAFSKHILFLYNFKLVGGESESAFFFSLWSMNIVKSKLLHTESMAVHSKWSKGCYFSCASE